MDLRLYSIYDRVAGTYSSPFCAVNEDSAKRYFSAVMKGKIEEKDAELYYIGGFNSSNGELDYIPERPEFVMRVEVVVNEK